MAEQESKGDLSLIEAVSDHIERYIDKIDIVMHEIVSSKVHIDVHVVRATPQRPYQTLVTSGMELPMQTPAELKDARLAELMICLPRDWPIDIESLLDRREVNEVLDPKRASVSSRWRLT